MKRNTALWLVLFGLGACGTEAGEDLTQPPPGMVMDDDPPLAGGGELRKDAPKDDSITFEGKADLPLPTSYDIVSLQTPVKSQGRRGVCSIFSTMGLMESLYLKAGMGTLDFSEQFLQWSVKTEVGAFRNSEGSSDPNNIAAIVRYGVPLETAWPYQPDPWTEANDPECKTAMKNLPTKCYTNGPPPASALSARRYKLPAGRYVSTRSIKNVLFERRQGVLVGMDFFYQAWNHRRSELPTVPAYFARGYVLYPNATDVQKSYEKPAGHSVQIVGWDDNLQIQRVDDKGKLMVDSSGKPVMEKGFYLFKNSWGTENFGLQNPKGKGYGYISYRYVTEYGSGYTADQPR